MTYLIIWLIFSTIIIIWVKVLRNSRDDDKKNLSDEKSWMYIMNPSFTKTENWDFIFSFSKIDDEWNPIWLDVSICSKEYKRLELVYPYNPYISFEITYEWNNVLYINLYKKGSSKELKNIETI